MEHKIYLDTINNVDCFFVNGNVVPAGQFLLEVEDDKFITIKHCSNYQKLIEHINASSILKKDNSYYANVSEFIYDNVSFFVKAAGGGGSIIITGSINHNVLLNRDARGNHSSFTPDFNSTASFVITDTDYNKIFKVDTTNKSFYLDYNTTIKGLSTMLKAVSGSIQDAVPNVDYEPILSSNTPLYRLSNTFYISQSSTNTNGYLSNTDWNTFNNKEVILSSNQPLYRLNNTFYISQSNTNQNGYLSNTDWNTFNNKEVILSSNTPIYRLNNTFYISQSSTNTNGYLSNTDWNTFNNKEVVLSSNTPLYRIANTFYISQSSVSSNGYLDSGSYSTFNNKENVLSANQPIYRLSNTFYISQSNTNQNGYLSNTDWNTFNSKENVISTNSPLYRIANTIYISQSNTNQNGYLSSTDWNIFNNKQNTLSGNSPIYISSSKIYVSQSSTSNDGYLSSTDWNIFEKHKYRSNGVYDVTIPSFTNNNDGTVTINSCNVTLRQDVDYATPLDLYNVPQQTISINDNGISNYVYAVYETGSVGYRNTLNRLDYENGTAALIYVFWRVGLKIHSANYDSIGLGLNNKINTRMLDCEPYRISNAGGLIISETITPNPRTIIVSEAVVYKGIVPETVFTFNSSTDIFTKVIVTPTNYTFSSSSLVYDNTVYNPASGNETTMTNGRWKFIHYYRSIGDDREVFWINSDSEYKLEGDAIIASETQRTDIPNVLKYHCLFIGRSIIQKSTTNGTTSPYVSMTGMFTSKVPNHNDTLSKQGGDINLDEYYHLDLRNYNLLTYTSGSLNITDNATNITTLNKIIRVTGTSPNSRIASISTGSFDLQQLRFEGGSDTNTVKFDTTVLTNVKFNNNTNFTLGQGDIIDFYWSNFNGLNKWIETYRSNNF